VPAAAYRVDVVCTSHPPASPWRFLPNRLRPASARNRPTVMASRPLDDPATIAAGGTAAIIAALRTTSDIVFDARAAAAGTAPRWHLCDLSTCIVEPPGPGVECGTSAPHPTPQ